MKLSLKHKYVSIALSVLLSVVSFLPGLAQPSDSPTVTDAVAIEREISPGHYKLSNGQSIYLPLADVGSASLHTSGGPDDFGYTWDDNVPLNWIDATDGTDTGMKGASNNQASGPLALPFAFPFYENAYSQIYVAAAGYVAFTPPAYWSNQPRLPFPLSPNDIIAPYASPLQLAESGTQNRVYYKSGGTTPNRYFVVEWYQVLPSSGFQGVLTFEVILYENGDILFQYQKMDFGQGGSRWCGNAGIENLAGTDGLATTRNCGLVNSNTAVKITRPSAAARSLLYPRSQGSFTTAARTQRFPVSIQNTGATGADLYKLTVDSQWQVQLETPNGIALTDSDNDGIMDTGTLAASATFAFVIVVNSPSIANTADSNLATITATSQNDPTVQKKTLVTLAIPAPFAQIYSTGNRNIHLLSAQPTTQSVAQIAESPYALDMAIAQIRGEQYASIWNESVANQGELFSWEIAYEILDRQGNPLHAKTWLTNDHNATHYVNNSDPAIAVTPDGHVGILWYQLRTTNDRAQLQFNIFFAILDHNGSIVLPPTNLTNKTDFGDYETIPSYDAPTIVGTSNNHFMLAWREYLWSSADNNALNNVNFMIYANTGTVSKPLSRLTNSDTLFQNRASSPTLTPLQNGDVLLTFATNFQQLAYGRLNSGGELISPLVIRDEAGHDNLDTVQLPNGNLLMGWQKYDYAADTTKVKYLLIDGTSLNPLGTPQEINPFPGTRHIQNVSVTYNAAGQGIITWSEREGFYLGYLLLDAQGTVLTSPTQFVNGSFSESVSNPVSVGDYGNGGDDNTPIAITPSTPTQSDLTLKTAAITGGQPGGMTTIYAQIDNQGLLPAENVQFTATLDPNLTLVSAEPMPDNLFAAAIQGGGTYTWTIPTIDYLGGGTVIMQTTVPSTTIGTTYPVTMTLTTTSPDAVPGNNETQTSVMEALFVFLPLIGR